MGKTKMFEFWLATDDSGHHGVHADKPVKNERGVWESTIGRAIIPPECYPQRGDCVKYIARLEEE